MARMKLASSNAMIRSDTWNNHNGSDAEPPEDKKNYEALVLFDDSINHCQRDNQNAPPIGANSSSRMAIWMRY